MPRQTWSTVTAPATPAVGDTLAAGPTWRHVSSKDGFPKLDNGNVATLHELFDRSRTKFADSPCLGWRPIVSVKGLEDVWGPGVRRGGACGKQERELFGQARWWGSPFHRSPAFVSLLRAPRAPRTRAAHRTGHSEPARSL